MFSVLVCCILETGSNQDRSYKQSSLLGASTSPHLDVESSNSSLFTHSCHILSCQHGCIGTCLLRTVSNKTHRSQLAQECIKKAQSKQKHQYDKKSSETKLQVDDRVMVHFPGVVHGKAWKFARHILDPTKYCLSHLQMLKCDLLAFTQHTLARIKGKNMPDVSTTFSVVLLSGKYKKEECSSYLYHREKGMHKYSGN